MPKSTWVRDIADRAPGFKALVDDLTAAMDKNEVHVERKAAERRAVKRQTSRVDALPDDKRAIYNKVARHVGPVQRRELLEMYERQVKSCQPSS